MYEAVSFEAEITANSFTGLSTKNGAAGIAGGLPKLLLDADELVVFGRPVGTGKRTRLDLTAIGGDGKVGDRRVLRFTGTV